MTVGSVIGGGVDFVRGHPRLVAIWAALYVVVSLLSMIVTRPLLASTLGSQQQQMAAAGTAAPVASPTSLILLPFALNLLFLVALAVAFAAIVRAVMQPAGDRFAYLRFGVDELRLIGLGILLVITGIVAELVGALIVVAAGFAVRAVGGTAAGVIVGVVLGLILFCALVYVQMRISLAGAFTVMRGRIVIGEAWRATKGHFWTLFGAYLIMGIGYLVVMLIIVALTNPALMSAYASMNPQRMMAAAQGLSAAESSGPSVGMLLQTVLIGVVMVVLGTVALAGFANAAFEASRLQSPENAFL